MQIEAMCAQAAQQGCEERGERFVFMPSGHIVNCG
jgi:hypothetical protein